MDITEINIPNTVRMRNKKHWFSIRRLRLSLKYRPEIFKLILKMRRCIRDKNVLLKKLSHQMKNMVPRTDSQDSTIKSIYKQDLSHNILKTNGTPDRELARELTDSQRDSLLKLSTLIESNLEGNLTDKAVISLDKSTCCESNVRDSSSQTKSENNSVNEYHNENTASDTIDLSKIDTAKLDKKEVSTETEYSFEDYKDTTLLKSDKRKLVLIDGFTQTDNVENSSETTVTNENKLDQSADSKTVDDKLGWTKTVNGEEEKSIAEQVKEAAQNAMQQSGMVYVESAGMYYDYKTGYYYNSELGLYYHTDTGCYYYYSEDQKTFFFHSYPERSENLSRPAKPISKSKALKKAKKADDIDNLTKNFSQDEEDGASKSKKRRLAKQKKKSKKVKSDKDKKDTEKDKENIDGQKDEQKDYKEKVVEVENKDESKPNQELEDGECSDSSGEKSDSSSDESDASTATASDDDSVAKHHPPCMRVIVRETSLPKLKVGSLFLITKDGGTIGREGEQHAILLKDYNVSRNHLDIKFDGDKRMYTASDLGSKNGTILNGVRMSESQEVSEPMEIVHGSTLQLGETKLLCHIHAGNDTCGHCEPGLIMEAEDKDKKIAYTRTCSVQVQHQLELARLKNKYAPQPLEITDFEYNDRARARREKVGSSHHAEKTQTSDLDTAIAADNKGFKLLEKMGWSKGEGLGKDSQGDTEPIPLISNEGKSGLGASPMPAPVVTNKLGPATLRLAARTKMLQPPAKAFQQPADDDSE